MRFNSGPANSIPQKLLAYARQISARGNAGHIQNIAPLGDQLCLTVLRSIKERRSLECHSRLGSTSQTVATRYLGDAVPGPGPVRPNPRLARETGRSGGAKAPTLCHYCNYSRTVLYLKWTPKAWRCIYLAARPLYWDQTVGTCDTVYTAYAVQL